VPFRFDSQQGRIDADASAPPWMAGPGQPIPQGTGCMAGTGACPDRSSVDLFGTRGEYVAGRLTFMDSTNLDAMPSTLRTVYDNCCTLEETHPGWECKPFYSAWENYSPAPERLSLFLLDLNVGGWPEPAALG